MVQAVVEFTLLAGVIVIAGTRLSHYADVIAEKTGLGRTWIGVVLIASVTSVPELATGVSAVAFYGVPDLAVGDVLGSCMFNLLIVAMIDFFGGGAPIATRAHPGQVVAAGFSILLLSVVMLALVAGKAFPSIGWIGTSTLLLLVGYALAMRTIFGHERDRISRDLAVPLRYADTTLARATFHYVFLALVIIASASFLPRVGAAIATETGLGETFVGNLFIAFSTSLPELVVCLAAIRIDAVDLALGNILGSNLFNMVILTIDDAVFLKGPILHHVSPAHGIAALIAIAMTAVVIVALTIRAERRFRIAWESAVILALYITAVALLYRMRIPVEKLA